MKHETLVNLLTELNLSFGPEPRGGFWVEGEGMVGVWKVDDYGNAIDFSIHTMFKPNQTNTVHITPKAFIHRLTK